MYIVMSVYIAMYAQSGLTLECSTNRRGSSKQAAGQGATTSKRAHVRWELYECTIGSYPVGRGSLNTLLFTSCQLSFCSLV